MNTADKDALVESVAKAIYEQWVAAPGYVAWVERGNSINQGQARSIASEAIAAAQLVSASLVAPQEVRMLTETETYCAGSPVSAVAVSEALQVLRSCRNCAFEEVSPSQPPCYGCRRNPVVLLFGADRWRASVGALQGGKE